MVRKNKTKITLPKRRLSLSASGRISKGRPPRSFRYVTPDEIYSLSTKLSTFAYACELMHEYAFGPNANQILSDFQEEWSEVSSLVLGIETLLSSYDENRLDTIKRNFLVDALPVYTGIVEEIFDGILTESDSKMKMETAMGPYLKKAGFADIRIPLGFLHVGKKDRKRAIDGPRRFAGDRLGSLINISYARIWGLYRKRGRRVFMTPLRETTETAIGKYRAEILYAFLTKCMGFNRVKAKTALKSLGLRAETVQKKVKMFPGFGSYPRYDHLSLVKSRPGKRKPGQGYKKH